MGGRGTATRRQPRPKSPIPRPATASSHGQAQCTARFKVGRSWKEERFELLALPELRGVVEMVLAQLGGDGGGGGGLELLKPFKMAHVSPRVFWNLVKHCGGDVRAGLQQVRVRVRVRVA